MKRFLLAAILCACRLFAQTSIQHETALNGTPSVVPIPYSLTAVVTTSGTPSYVRVQYVTLHNVTASAVTVKVLDKSTNCNSGPCPVVSSTSGAQSLSIGANTTYTVALYGQPAVGGIQWQASSANAVMGWIQWIGYSY